MFPELIGYSQQFSLNFLISMFLLNCFSSFHFCFLWNQRKISFSQYDFIFILCYSALDQEMRPCELSGIYSIRTRMPYSYNHKIMTNYSRLVSLLDSRFMCQEKDLKLRSNCEEPEMFQFICTTDNRIKSKLIISIVKILSNHFIFNPRFLLSRRLERK